MAQESNIKLNNLTSFPRQKLSEKSTIQIYYPYLMDKSISKLHNDKKN